VDVKENEKRKSILIAATDVFSKKGFHEATIEDIARTAGIGKGTVYEYFSSKDELFIEMVKFNIQQYQYRLKHQIDMTEGFINKLDAFIGFHYDIIRQNVSFINTICFNNAFLLDSYTMKRQFELIMMARAQIVEMLSQILCVGQMEGKIRNIDRGFVADIFYAMVVRCCMRGILSDLDINCIKKDREQLIDLILRGIT
jgi:TetR/AcrR family fatty acid metabolism transcriptional regulator